MPGWMSVTDAAAVLGVQQRQVRNLIEQSELDAERVGHVWLVSSASVEARRLLGIEAGRPLSAGSAWRMLARIDAALHGDLSSIEEPADRRARYRLRQLQNSSPPVEQWSSWLRRRAEHRRVWFHLGAMKRIASDRRAVRPDLSTQLGLDVSDLGHRYVDAAQFDAFVERHRGEVMREPNSGAVDVVVVPTLADDINWHSYVEAAVLVDLSAHPDARVRHASVQLLGAAAAGLARDARRSTAVG